MHPIKALRGALSIFREDAAFIAANKEEITRENRTILRKMSVTYLAVELLYLAISLLWPAAELPSGLIALASGIQLLYIAWAHFRATRRDDSYTKVLMDCMLFAVLIQALVITLSVFINPDHPGVLFYPMLICMSLFYTLPYIATLSALTGYALIFLVFSFVFKSYNVFTLDLVGTITAWVLAVVSSHMTLSLRIRDAATRARLQEMATTDPLTRLCDKVTMQLLCEEYLADRQGTLSCVLVIFDIDNYKEINDSLGHRAGDELLIEYAALLGDVFGRDRSHTLIGRFGGDEFVVLVKDTDDEAAVAALYRELCRRTREELGRKFSVPISCSAGAACLHDRPFAYNDLFDRADRALYAAKDGGKDRVEFFREGTSRR